MHVFLHFAVGILTAFTQVTEDCKYGSLIQVNPPWIHIIATTKYHKTKPGIWTSYYFSDKDIIKICILQQLNAFHLARKIHEDKSQQFIFQ